MFLNESQIKKIVNSLILENSKLHRCLNGDIVPAESSECLDDIILRIEDATYARNEMTSGTATRAYYNGVLADLRKKRRRLEKTQRAI
jgi:hypothetical protein